MTEKRPAKIEDDLDENSRDLVVAITKGLVGIAPGIGSTLAEMVGFTIPRQRIDRVVDFVRKLAIKVENHEEIIQRMQTPEGADLVEEAMVQASRASTDVRREYIANLLKNSLTRDEIKHEQKKRLFDILSQLSDSEIILLKYYSLNIISSEPHPYAIKHKHVIDPIDTTSVKIDTTFLNSYIGSLDKLGLLVYSETSKSKHPEHTKASPLANLLLDYIEVPDEPENSPKE